MSGILKEPLLHFMLLGVAIFAGYRWLGTGANGEREIVVTSGQQASLLDTFERTWRRPPTPAERDGLVRDYIREEIAYREAQAMELDGGDIVIRRRLRQKLELLTEDLASLAPPTAEELAEFLAANAERFRVDAVYSLEQVYVSTDLRGPAAAGTAEALLERLRSGETADVASLGDPIGLPPRLRNASESELAATFGSAFALELGRLAVGSWTGPVRSGYGLHLVRVTDRVASRIPALDEIADDVRYELQAERRRDAVDALYAALAERYAIRIEPLAAGGGP